MNVDAAWRAHFARITCRCIKRCIARSLCVRHMQMYQMLHHTLTMRASHADVNVSKMSHHMLTTCMHVNVCSTEQMDADLEESWTMNGTTIVELDVELGEPEAGELEGDDMTPSPI